MLTEFFESPQRIQELRDGPNGCLLEGFADQMCRAGYAEITAVRATFSCFGRAVEVVPDQREGEDSPCVRPS